MADGAGNSINSLSRLPRAEPARARLAFRRPAWLWAPTAAVVAAALPYLLLSPQKGGFALEVFVSALAGVDVALAWAIFEVRRRRMETRLALVRAFFVSGALAGALGAAVAGLALAPDLLAAAQASLASLPVLALASGVFSLAGGLFFAWLAVGEVTARPG